MKILKHIVATLLICIPTADVRAQDEAAIGADDRSAYFGSGDLDVAFGSGGYVSTNFGLEGVHYASAAFDEQGRILVRATVSNGDDSGALLVRFRPDGTIDTTFGVEGTIFDDSFSSGGAVQEDGSVILAGWTAGAVTFGRYLPDGEFDTSFGTDGTTVIDFENDIFILRLTVQRDDRILILAGTGETRPANVEIARLNGDGSLDTTFGTDGLTRVDFNESTWALDLIELSDGKILAIGCCDTRGISGFAQLNSDGTLHPSFGVDGVTEVEMPLVATAAALQADGKIVIGGYSGDIDEPGFMVARYTVDGRLDGTFGTDGIAYTDVSGDLSAAFDLAIQADGKIVLEGQAKFSVLGYYDIALVRYNPDGSLDDDFGDGGVWIWDVAGKDDAARDLAIDEKGRLVVASTAGTDFVLSRHVTEVETGTAAERSTSSVRHITLRQNFPNPFYSATTIEFDLPAPLPTSLTIYDMLGRKMDILVSQHLNAGRHTISWRPHGIAGGLYVYRLCAGDVVLTRQMTVLPGR